MRFGLLTALSALAASVVADVEFTSPAAGASLVAGSAITIKWEDSGVAPALSALSIYSIFLCAGGNTAGSFVCPRRHVHTSVGTQADDGADSTDHSWNTGRRLHRRIQRYGHTQRWSGCQR